MLKHEVFGKSPIEIIQESYKQDMSDLRLSGALIAGRVIQGPPDEQFEGYRDFLVINEFSDEPENAVTQPDTVLVLSEQGRLWRMPIVEVGYDGSSAEEVSPDEYLVFSRDVEATLSDAHEQARILAARKDKLAQIEKARILQSAITLSKRSEQRYERQAKEMIEGPGIERAIVREAFKYLSAEDYRRLAHDSLPSIDQVRRDLYIDEESFLAAIEATAFSAVIPMGNARIMVDLRAADKAYAAEQFHITLATEEQVGERAQRRSITFNENGKLLRGCNRTGEVVDITDKLSSRRLPESDKRKQLTNIETLIHRDIMTMRRVNALEPRLINVELGR